MPRGVGRANVTARHSLMTTGGPTCHIKIVYMEGENFFYFF